MRIGSIFSGYGGADLAVRSVWPDATPAWFVEFDKHRGVCFDRTRKKWKATWGKRSLGRFATFEQAVAARRAMERDA